MKKILSLASLLFLAVISSQCGKDPVLATYDGGKIMESRVLALHSIYSLSQKELSPDVLGRMAREIVLTSLAAQDAKSKDMEQNSNVVFFRDVLLPVKIKQSMYLQEIKKDALEEKQTFYKIKHILFRPEPNIDTMQKATEIFNQIESGQKKFDAAAKEFSADKKSAEKGGDLGYVPAVTLPASVRTSIEKLIREKKKLSSPISAPYGVQIIYLESVKKMDRKSFASVWKKQNKNVPNIENQIDMIWQRVAGDTSRNTMNEIISGLASIPDLSAIPESADPIFQSANVHVARSEWNKYIEFMRWRFGAERMEDPESLSRMFNGYVREKLIAAKAESAIARNQKAYDIRYQREYDVFLYEIMGREIMNRSVALTEEDYKAAYDRKIVEASSAGTKPVSYSDFKKNNAASLLTEKQQQEKNKWEQELLAAHKFQSLVKQK